MAIKTSRTRSRNTYSNGFYKVYSNVGYPYGIKWGTPVTYAASSSGELSTISDTNNGPFKKGVTFVFGDVRLVRKSRIVTPGDVFNFGGRYQGDLSTVMPVGVPGAVNVTSSKSGRLESGDYLLIKAYAKMNDSNVLIGEMAHSLSETAGMLRRPFGSAVSLLTKMVKSRNRMLKHSSMSVAKANANSWLEYRYGWIPLMMDVNSIMGLYRKKLDTSRRVLVARSGSATAESSKADWSDIVSSPTQTTSGSFSSSIKTSRSAGVLYEIYLKATSDAAAQAMGSRSSDLPATLWEIIPFSFVVDWFVNVGDWVRASTPTPGIMPIGNWVTDISDRTSYCANQGIKPRAGTTYVYAGDYGALREQSFTYTRETMVKLSRTPVLRVNGLSVLHQFDALALASGQILTMLKNLRH